MTLKLISLQLLGIASAAIPSFHITQDIRHVGCLCHHQPISLTGICTIWFRLTQASFDDVHILSTFSDFHCLFPYFVFSVFKSQSVLGAVRAKGKRKINKLFSIFKLYLRSSIMGLYNLQVD